MRVLIDAGMGAGHLTPLKKWGIDTLILTHCHIDHRLTRKEIPDVPVWCHEAEALFLNDRNFFLDAVGMQRSGVDLSAGFNFSDDMFATRINRYLSDGECLDLGGITLEVIHTPGHSPGHLAFYIPEANLLFTADVDLTSFGPFYGHDFADIDEFLQSIERLRQLNAGIVATGHAGPFSDRVVDKFNMYEEIIYQRERQVLELLTQPRAIGDFKGRNLIFRTYADFPDLMRWFEIVHIEKHLKRLKTLGKVEHIHELWSINE